MDLGWLSATARAVARSTSWDSAARTVSSVWEGSITWSQVTEAVERVRAGHTPVVDLRGVRLGSAGAAAVSAALRECTTMMDLRLDSNDLDDTAAVLIAEALAARRGHPLVRLTASDNRLSGDGVSGLVVACGAGLAALHVSMNALGNEGASQVARVVGTWLRELHLSACGIGPAAALVIRDHLLPRAQRLLELDLSNNPLQSEGVVAVCTGARRCLSLRMLSLVNCEVDASAGVALGSLLSHRPSSLTNVRLSRNPSFGDEGLAKLVRTLTRAESTASRQPRPPPDRTLRRLELGHCGLTEDCSDDLATLVRPSSLPRLQRLRLDGNENLTGDALTRMGAMLASEGASLTSLDLEQDLPASRLSVASIALLFSCVSLRELCVDGCRLGSNLAVAVTSSPSRSMRSLSARRNDLSDADCESLAHWMATSTALRDLTLADNDIGADGTAALARALVQSPSLRVLSLAGNHVGDGGAAELAAALPRNTSLHVLDLYGSGVAFGGAMLLCRGLSECSGLQLLDITVTDDYDSGFSWRDAFTLEHLLKDNRVCEVRGITARRTVAWRSARRARRAQVVTWVVAVRSRQRCRRG